MTRVAARRSVVLLGSCAFLLMASPHAVAQPTPAGREAYLVIVDDATMEELLSVAPFRSLATVGGAGLLSDRLPLREIERYLLTDVGGPSPPLVVPVAGLVYDDEGSLALPPRGFAVSRALDLADRLRAEMVASPADEVLLIIASASPPAGSQAAGDELSGIVLASGAPDQLAAALASAGEGEAGSLTSDSTRRSGVVTTRDIATTVLTFLDQPSADGDPGGSVIRVVEGPPPYDLHERYLALRRMVVPVGIGAGLYVTLVGLVAIGLLWQRRRAPSWALAAVSALALSAPVLVVGMFAAGHLPSLSYATVVPFLVAVTGVTAVAVAVLARRDPLRPAAWIGAGVLAFFAVESLVGWTAALTPLLGGSQLDGGRFYGLPNAFVGLLIGAPLYLAHRRRTAAGVALLLAVGLFAGLPGVGANLGGSVAVFATAGLWLALRERERLGVWKGVAVVAGVTVLGTAAILVAHRISPVPTHVTRFEEAAGGLGGAWSTFSDRLMVGWRLIERNPFALIPVLGLLAVVWVIVRPPASIRDGFEGRAGWRDAMLAVALGGIVAYVANDSGAAACGQAFTMSVAGTLFVAMRVALAARTGKMGGS